MPNTPYTQQRNFQPRGPQRSEEYNETVEQQIADLIYLFNKANQIDFDMDKKFAVDAKNLIMLARMLDNFESRLQVLESGLNRLGIKSSDQIDTARFAAVPSYTVAAVDQLTYDSQYNFLVLPRNDDSSVSKIKYINDDGTSNISSYLEMNVLTDGTSADGNTATIDTSPPYFAVQGLTGRIWERNVITAAPNANGAIMHLYIRVPEDLSINAYANNIRFNPFPAYGTDILEVSYTTNSSPALTNAETWTKLNEYSDYYGNIEAVGYVAPGAWSGDEILNSSMKSFYFDQKPITAVRLKLRQRNYFKEGSNYIYSYGLSDLDIRLDKFNTSGKTIIRYDAPVGDTISSITDIIPRVWNVPASQVDDVISTRVIWETSYNSGSYTLTPVPFSQRVWVEVSMTETINHGTPVLSDLILEYS